MRRTLTALAATAVLGAVVTAVPASAESTKGPKVGTWTCTDAAAAPLASLELFKGNKYALDGGDKAKYVYKVGQQKMKFKTGDFAVYYGLFDTETKTLALHSVADDAAAGSCTRDEVVVTPAP